MIGSLTGQVAALAAETALVEVGGVGYLVHAGSRTLARLALGETARLIVETHVREDAIRLYGFLAEDERAWFVHLQSVPSVGAKVALSVLDALAPAELADAIALQDKAALARANGVGQKLAARIVQELAGKAPPGGAGVGRTAPAAEGAGARSGSRSEAVSALVNLGIDQSTALRAAAAAVAQLGEGAQTPDLIRAALKEIQA